MSDLDKILDRLDRLESKDAIRGLVTAYAIACDEHDLPRLSSLFTDDATFSSSSGAVWVSGRDAIAAMFIETLKTRGPAFHWTHDVSVEIDPDDPDSATGLVYSHAETTPNGVVSLAAMKYVDGYRRADGRWRFSKRTVNFLYYVPFAEYGDGLNSEKRLFSGGERVPADYPESLPQWQEFHRRHIGRT
ncbi:MAG: SgcJ/EcaC family oxidoreductase [Alphaproteobacteria bacterium]|nr:SgcJ/EcaC family oxidoreductase [Alphaproteobacteria bacterium]